MKYRSNKNSTLLEALLELSPKSSKTTLRSWIKEGRVSVDNAIQKHPNFPILEGQVVALGPKAPQQEEGLKILYEDAHLVAIEKPAGLLSVSTNFEKGQTAHAILKYRYKPRKVFVVHRLDQDTSGVMLFALSEKAYEQLKEMFEKHDIVRKYLAVTEGNVEEDKGSWRSYLYEDSRYIVHETQNPEIGDLAITHYVVLTKTKKYSLLEITLETGRKNQIRVHCQKAGHPIVGDKKYGAKTNPLKRLGLHAYYLSFAHPITGKRMIFESPIPATFQTPFSSEGTHA